MTEPLVAFKVHKQDFALPIAEVNRIVHVVEITPLPNPENYIEGVINLHGKLVPILDINRRLNLPRSSIKITDHLIICNWEKNLLGFVVNHINFIEAPKKLIENVTPILGEVDCTERIFKDKEGPIQILNTQKLMKNTNSKEMNGTLTESQNIPLNPVNQILKDRAKSLANRPEEKSEIQNQIEIIEFKLNKELYGIETKYIQKVNPLRDLTLLPGVTPFMMGIINVHSQILPVFDLKKLFELSEQKSKSGSKVIILKANDINFGISADEVFGVKKFSLQSLQTNIPTLTGVRSDFLKGVTDTHIAILDALKLSQDKRILINEGV